MKGIKVVIGVYKTKGPRGGTTEIQSILIPKTYSQSQAKAWLSKHGFYRTLDEGRKYWRARQVDPEEFIRMRTISFNPGARWHESEEKFYEKLIRSAKNKIGSSYFEGKRDAHRHSKEASRTLKMNPKGKWYIGLSRFGLSDNIIKISGDVTKSKFGKRFKQMIGPFDSYKDVEIEAKKRGIIFRKGMKSNPIQSQIVDKIYDKILSIEAKKGNNSLWPNENFRHDFKEGGGIFGLQDGSLLIKSKNKKPLWKRINYNL